MKAFTLGLSHAICWYILASKLQKLPLSGLPIVKKFTIVLQYHPKCRMVLQLNCKKKKNCFLFILFPDSALPLQSSSLSLQSSLFIASIFTLHHFLYFFSRRLPIFADPSSVFADPSMVMGCSWVWLGFGFNGFGSNGFQDWFVLS